MIGSTSIYADDTEESEKPKRKVNTLVGSLSDDIYVSGYGAIIPTYSRIKGEDAFLCGFRGGLILDNVVLGFSVTGLAYPYKREDFGNDSFTDNKPYVNFGYGGAMMEYYFFPKKQGIKYHEQTLSVGRIRYYR